MDYNIDEIESENVAKDGKYYQDFKIIFKELKKLKKNQVMTITYNTKKEAIYMRSALFNKIQRTSDVDQKFDITTKVREEYEEHKFKLYIWKNE